MQSYIDQPCPRCGSKKRISKTWKETLPTFSGTTTVDCMQIVCTNDNCQAAFDKNLLEETEKRNIIRMKKEASEKQRKENAMSFAKKNSKNR